MESVAEQINTENAEVGDTRGGNQLVEMPINSRAQTTSPLASLTLSPNVVTDNQGNIAVGGATFARLAFPSTESPPLISLRTALFRTPTRRPKGLANSKSPRSTIAPSSPRWLM